MSEGAVTVLLVDDHAVVREGYRRLLERSGNIDVIGEAEDADSAFARFRELAPQVVVMDIALPGVSGVEAMRRMLEATPATRVLMFSMYEDAIFATRALQAGASGYVSKASAPNVLVEAVLTVAFARREATPWSRAGHVVATDEIVLRLALDRLALHYGLGSVVGTGSRLRVWRAPEDEAPEDAAREP